MVLKKFCCFFFILENNFVDKCFVLIGRVFKLSNIRTMNNEGEEFLTTFCILNCELNENFVKI